MATASALADGTSTRQQLWKKCAIWLTSWDVIRSDHRANWPEASMADIATILRDGVLLCKLLNKIDAKCIDMKEVNLKPTMAQFLSLHNINMFLKTCMSVFGLKEHDLFDPLMLFDLTNFHQVLCTLSKLSLTEKAQQRGIAGFTSYHIRTQLEEESYQCLKSVELSSYSRRLTDSVCNVESEKIYQDLCVLQNSTELQPTLEKRDFVICELLDTEQKYVDVLEKLKTNFMRPLLNYMRGGDHEIIFFNIAELFEIHNGFYNELSKIRIDAQVQISEIFFKWRERFLVYGSYCANVSKATNLLQELCDNNPAFNQVVIKYEKEDNNGRFKLRDVLFVPMQRILKYHLLLEKLIDNTDPNHEEYNDIRRCREAMLDVAAFINEVARDTEHLAVIDRLQENIVEWVHTSESRLSNYGRLIKDGELKVKAHDEQKTKNRYVFIFDKCILVCKQLKGQQFAFCNMIHIADYHVDEMYNRTLMNRDTRWSYHFHLVKNDNVMVYTFIVRSSELKNQMVSAINDALENIHPQALKRTNHQFELHTFDKYTQCFHCSKYLRGLIYQGYKCTVCNVCVHKCCIAYSGRCGVFPLQQIFSPIKHRTSYDETDSLHDKLWFVGDMDRCTAQNVLYNRENGTFLVRVRSHGDDKNKYALTLKTNNTVKHMKICKQSDSNEQSKFYLSLSKFFNSIEELVINYQLNSLKENFARLEENAKLVLPYKQLHATVLKSFEATEEHHLTVREGSQLIIIGKEGYRDGWWKGRNDRNEVGFFPSTCVKVDGEVNFTF